MAQTARDSEFARAARDSFGSINRFARDLYSSLTSSSRNQRNIIRETAEEAEHERVTNSEVKGSVRTLDDLIQLNNKLLSQFREFSSNIEGLVSSITGGGILGGVGGALFGAAIIPSMFNGPEETSEDISGDYDTTDSEVSSGGLVQGREIDREEITAEEGGLEKFGIDTRRVSRIVDTRMEDILKGAAENFPLRVRVISGHRSNSSGHRKGAMDVMIYDQEGNPINAYQSSESANIYAMFAEKAREKQMELYPEFNKPGGFVWGGGWSGFKETGKKATYGAADYMDFRFNWAEGPAYRFADQRKEGESGWQEGYENYAENDILGIGASRGFTEEDYKNLENFVLNPEDIQTFEELGFGTYLGSQKLPPVPRNPDVKLTVPETAQETQEASTPLPETAQPAKKPSTPPEEPAQPTKKPSTPPEEPAQPAKKPSKHTPETARPAKKPSKHTPETARPAEETEEVGAIPEEVIEASQNFEPTTNTPILQSVNETPSVELASNEMSTMTPTRVTRPEPDPGTIQFVTNLDHLQEKKKESAFA